MTEERPLNERPAARPAVVPGLPEEAQNGSSPGEPTGKKKPGCFSIGCGGLIAIVVAVAIFGSMAGGSSSSNKEGLAIVACQGVVKNNLRSPSTANFPNVPTYSGGKITGVVDAENGFGATVRSSFQCTVEGERVRLDYLR